MCPSSGLLPYFHADSLKARGGSADDRLWLLGKGACALEGAAKMGTSGVAPADKDRSRLEGLVEEGTEVSGG